MGARMTQHYSFFRKHQKSLALAATLYLVLLLLSHWQLPPIHVWVIAAVFSVAMNFTYLAEAIAAKKFVSVELAVTSILIVLSVLGALVWPPFVIAAVFGHGVWDLAKHYGMGVPFFSWYTLSCAGCCCIG